MWHGKKKSVPVHIEEDVYKTIHKRNKKYLKVKINYDGPIPAPISKGQNLGKMEIFIKDEKIDSFDLIASENIKKQNFISRIISSVNYLIWGDV